MLRVIVRVRVALFDSSSPQSSTSWLSESPPHSPTLSLPPRPLLVFPHPLSLSLSLSLLHHLPLPPSFSFTPSLSLLLPPPLFRTGRVLSLSLTHSLAHSLSLPHSLSLSFTLFSFSLQALCVHFYWHQDESLSFSSTLLSLPPY